MHERRKRNNSQAVGKRRGMTFPIKMKVANIYAYKKLLTSFDLNKTVGLKFRKNEARKRERDV